MKVESYSETKNINLKKGNPKQLTYYSKFPALLQSSDNELHYPSLGITKICIP